MISFSHNVFSQQIDIQPRRPVGENEPKIFAEFSFWRKISNREAQRLEACDIAPDILKIFAKAIANQWAAQMLVVDFRKEEKFGEAARSLFVMSSFRNFLKDLQQKHRITFLKNKIQLPQKLGKDLEEKRLLLEILRKEIPEEVYIREARKFERIAKYLNHLSVG